MDGRTEPKCRKTSFLKIVQEEGVPPIQLKDNLNKMFLRVILCSFYNSIRRFFSLRKLYSILEKLLKWLDFKGILCLLCFVNHSALILDFRGGRISWLTLPICNIADF